MQKNSVKFFLYVIAATFVAGLYVGGSLAVGSETADLPKKVRDPHQVHFELGKDIPPIGFSVREIIDWPNFTRSLQAQIALLPFSQEMKFLIERLMPGLTSIDEKKVVLSEINKFLKLPDFYSQMKIKVSVSDTTMQLLSDYQRKKTNENLQWLNRSIINDILPPAPRVAVREGKKYDKLRNINCLTCHEDWQPVTPVVKKKSALTPLEQLTRMIQTQLINPPPSSLPQPESIPFVADDDFLRQYNSLKKLIVRPDTRGNPMIIEAVHPENPYTWKPLLKRLVCIDCHGPSREINDIKHANGKTHKIKYLYGPTEKTLEEQHDQ
ncbi:MAG: hypothetical protein L3J69_09940 [Desulfobacula sp.]|nr:hypothetical protein [Desulfobacula sp.]